jgi:pimeloyl-ACP methyl ester carboxylesterase
LTLGLQCFAKIPSAMGPRVFSDSELDGVRTPVLYIAGQDEKLCSVKAAAARLASIAPQVQRAVFPAAGHALITVHEQAVSDRVLQFLGA